VILRRVLTGIKIGVVVEGNDVGVKDFPYIEFLDTGFALFTPLNSKTIQLGRNTRIARKLISRRARRVLRELQITCKSGVELHLC